MDEFVSEIVEALTIELEATDPRFNANVLEVKVRNAIREVRQRRNYPTTWSEAKVTTDLQNYYSTIINLARYDYNQIGAEGETQHQESGVTRHYQNREELFQSVFAFVTVLSN